MSNCIEYASLNRAGGIEGRRELHVPGTVVVKGHEATETGLAYAPVCHRRMVITTLFSVFLAALQRRPVLYHSRWLLTVLWLWSSGH